MDYVRVGGRGDVEVVGGRQGNVVRQSEAIAAVVDDVHTGGVAGGKSGRGDRLVGRKNVGVGGGKAVHRERRHPGDSQRHRVIERLRVAEAVAVHEKTEAAARRGDGAGGSGQIGQSKHTLVDVDRCGCRRDIA